MSSYEILPTIFGFLLAFWLVHELRKKMIKKEIKEDES